MEKVVGINGEELIRKPHVIEEEEIQEEEEESEY